MEDEDEEYAESTDADRVRGWPRNTGGLASLQADNDVQWSNVMDDWNRTPWTRHHQPAQPFFRNSDARDGILEVIREDFDEIMGRLRDLTRRSSYANEAAMEEWLVHRNMGIGRGATRR